MKDHHYRGAQKERLRDLDTATLQSQKRVPQVCNEQGFARGTGHLCFVSPQFRKAQRLVGLAGARLQPNFPPSLATTVVSFETPNYLIYSVYSLKCAGHYILIYAGKSFSACFL